MATNLTAEQTATLESLIDKTTLSAVVEAIAQVCYDKAEHLESNWQDATSARAWRHAAARILKTAVNKDVEAVSL